MFKKDFFTKFTILHSFLGNFYLDQVFAEKMLIGNLYLASALLDYILFFITSQVRVVRKLSSMYPTSILNRFIGIANESVPA